MMYDDFSHIPLTRYYFPKDLKKYIGEYVVYFSDEKDPKVLFHSVDYRKAYAQADKMGKGYKKPLVELIRDDFNKIRI